MKEVQIPARLKKVAMTKNLKFKFMFSEIVLVTENLEDISDTRIVFLSKITYVY